MKFIVTKAKWLRNRTMDKGIPKDYKYDGGVLLSDNGMMCCLGHCHVQLGIPKESMFDKQMPRDLEIYKSLVICTNPFVDDLNDTYLSCQASLINDDPYSTSEKKIVRLTMLFKEHGHEIEFV